MSLDIWGNNRIFARESVRVCSRSAIQASLMALAQPQTCTVKFKTTKIMEAIIERKPGRVTVSMSTRRWNRMLQLEEAYKLARIIKRSMKQVETEPSMTPEEAIEQLRAL